MKTNDVFAALIASGDDADGTWLVVAMGPTKLEAGLAAEDDDFLDVVVRPVPAALVDNYQLGAVVNDDMTVSHYVDRVRA